MKGESAATGLASAEGCCARKAWAAIQNVKTANNPSAVLKIFDGMATSSLGSRSATRWNPSITAGERVQGAKVQQAAPTRALFILPTRATGVYAAQRSRGDSGGGGPMP